MTTMRLTYFAFPGLAQPIRDVAKLGNLELLDDLLPGSEAGYTELRRRRAENELGPCGVVPLLEVFQKEGNTTNRILKLNQAAAILRFVGGKARYRTIRKGSEEKPKPLYPADDEPVERALCDQADELAREIGFRLLPAHYGAAQPRSLKTGLPSVCLSAEQKEELNQVLNEDVLPSKLGQLEALLGDSNLDSGGDFKPFFLGKRLTTCDLTVAALVTELLSGPQGAPPGVDGERVLSGCPGLRAHCVRVRQLVRDCG